MPEWSRCPRCGAPEPEIVHVLEDEPAVLLEVRCTECEAEGETRLGWAA